MVAGWTNEGPCVYRRRSWRYFFCGWYCPGKGEEDFLADRTPQAYSNRSRFPDHGTYGRYQGIATGVCTAVCRILCIEPWQKINYLVTFCETVSEYLLIYLMNYCNQSTSYTLYWLGTCCWTTGLFPCATPTEVFLRLPYYLFINNCLHYCWIKLPVI